MIFYDQKIIFVHIYKAAGTSIAEGIKKGLNSSPGPVIVNARKAVLSLANRLPSSESSKRQLWKHAGAREYKMFLGQAFLEYYSFGFTRNPYDWQISIYEYIKNNPSHYLHNSCASASFRDYLLSGVAEATRSQNSFLFCEDGTQLVTTIGRMECIEKDWKRVSADMHFKYLPLDRLNKTPRNMSISCYYDEELALLIQRRFKEDFYRLGYSPDINCYL